MNNRILYMVGNTYNSLMDMKNVASIHYDKTLKCLYVNDDYVSSNKEQIDLLIEGWCGYHQFDVEEIKKKLFGE